MVFNEIQPSRVAEAWRVPPGRVCAVFSAPPQHQEVGGEGEHMLTLWTLFFCELFREPQILPQIAGNLIRK